VTFPECRRVALSIGSYLVNMERPASGLPSMWVSQTWQRKPVRRKEAGRSILTNNRCPSSLHKPELVGEHMCC
jgi:hypothetical protein